MIDVRVSSAAQRGQVGLLRKIAPLRGENTPPRAGLRCSSSLRGSPTPACARQLCIGLLVFCLLSPSPAASGTTYYVSATGSDSNPGTSVDRPFRTIQKAASVMAPGDTCLIRGGTYRETVTPNSGTTFKPYTGEGVTVSGADVVEGWARDSGSVFKARMGWDMGRGANQVFVDGQMVLEARYPNTPFDRIVTPTTARAQSVSVTDSAHPLTVHDQGLTQPAGSWNGATIVFVGRWSGPAGYPYAFETGRVTSYSPGVLTIQLDDAYDRTPPDGQPSDYFLVGTSTALDHAGSWIRGSDGSLYLWTPGSDDPSTHLIEAKRRAAAFNLNGKSGVTIQGLNIVAANITTDAGSSNNIIDGISATYPLHFTVLDRAPTGDPGNSHVREGGIVLAGMNNALTNSWISYSAGSGVTLLAGSGQTVFNNVIHDVGYGNPGGGPGVSTGLQVEDGGANTRNDQVTYNVVYSIPGVGIDYTAEIGGKIVHNDIYQAMLLDLDGGGIYGSGTHDAQTLEIAYNWVHDIPSDPNEVVRCAIYLDNEEGGIVIHHNVVWNVDLGLNANGGPPQSASNQIYNNTFSTRSQAFWIVNGGSPSLFQIKNNIFDKSYSLQAAVVENNIEAGTDPNFVDPADHNFALQDNSPAIDRGLLLPPWTDGYFGSAPDIGAYEWGLPAWTPRTRGRL